MKRIASVILLALIIAGAWFVRNSASLLVVDNPQRSDVIVVLAGDTQDSRIYQGLDLLRAGYAQRMIIDVPDESAYGVPRPVAADRFIQQVAPDLRDRISICKIQGLSTNAESYDLRACMQPLPSSAIVVSSDYHTRRALSILRARFPSISWTAGATRVSGDFGDPWWTRRQWAKNNLDEWQRFLWWKLVESHVSRP